MWLPSEVTGFGGSLCTHVVSAAGPGRARKGWIVVWRRKQRHVLNSRVVVPVLAVSLSFFFQRSSLFVLVLVRWGRNLAQAQYEASC